MVKWSRYLLGTFVVIAIFGAVGVVLKSFPVAAEGINSFPNITNSSDWQYNNKSPDPNLMWLFKGSGPQETIHGKTTHVLRNRSIGRNKGTRLRIYYAERPRQVSVKMNVVQCDLDAPWAYGGHVRVVLGGQTKYDQETVAPKKEVGWVVFRDWVIRSKANGGSYYRDSTATASRYANNDNAERFSNSPVCNNYGSYTVPVVKREENCGNWNNAHDNCQAGAGTYAGQEATNRSPHTVPGTDTKLDGRTFTVNFPATGNGNASMGYDVDTGLYFADLDIDLDARDETQVPSNVVQRIDFTVTANNVPKAANGQAMSAKMGYRYFDDEREASKYFGLQGSGGTNNEYPDYGQKMAIPFGMNCSSTVASQNGTITLYDPDAGAGGFGASYAAVYRRNPSTGQVTRLGQSAYTFGSHASWDAANTRIIITGGSGQNSQFTVNIVRGYQYMLTISNPNHAGGGNPATNVWSLRLPTDSINGLINCRYDLKPKMINVKSTFSAYGETLSPTGSVENTEESTTAGEHTWRITKAVFASKPTSMAGGDSTLAPCDFMEMRAGATPTSCNTIYTGTYPTDTSKTLNDPSGTHTVGTYVCYMTSVYNPTWEIPDDTKWRHSGMQCSVAGVSPKIQVWGGDARATGAVQTSVVNVNTRRYGSWGEYGVFSNGTNSLMGSGAGLAVAPANSTQASWSNLTFGNISSYGNFGGDLTAAAISRNGAQAYTSSTVNSLADVLPAGKTHATIVKTGTLTINGDLEYQGTASSISQLQKVVIIADDIIIGPNVKKIDPWLVANRISTCSTVANFSAMTTTGLLRSGICNQQLKFNGPVIANQVYLYRTFDDASGNPAENFNLRADNFLSSYVGGSGMTDPVASTNSVTELPPRF